jgi:hypothetical protein
VPLAVPQLGDGLAEAEANEAIRLFIERAHRVLPGYEPTAEDLLAVAQVCRTLDGLPLGIELAAARIGLLPPRALAERLTRHLDVPGTGARDLPTRQRTLEGTIAWSYDLLDEPAQRLLARLSVFAGGFRFDEAEVVAGPEGELGIDFIEGLARLADHSLVQPIQGPDLPRFGLLETIRRFASERLSRSDDAATIGRRHAVAYLELAEEAARHMPAREQVPWLDRLSVEHDNVRAAIAWSIETGEAELAHRLVAAAWRFWQFRGHVTEGRARAAAVLAMPGSDAPTTWRMRALEAAGGLAWWGSGVDAADQFYQRQLDIARRLGDKQGTADGLFNLIHSRFSLSTDPAEGERMHAEAERLYRDLDDDVSLARLNWSVGYSLMLQGQLEAAGHVVEESLAKFEALDDEYYIALAAAAGGGMAIATGNLDYAFSQGLRALHANQRMGDIASLTLLLLPSAALLFMVGLVGEAATVHAAYEAHRRRYGVQPPLDVESWLGFGDQVEEMRAVVNGEDFAEEHRRGARMTTDAVVEFLSVEAEPRFRAARARRTARPAVADSTATPGAD